MSRSGLGRTMDKAQMSKILDNGNLTDYGYSIMDWWLSRIMERLGIDSFYEEDI